MRGCSEKLASILGNEFSVIGISKPNATMGAISDFTYLKAEKLSIRDVVIICGGARDVARNETKEGLRFIFKFVKLLTNTNVIVTCVPHRFDLQAESYVNKEVELFNRKLQKQMKTLNHAQVCNISKNREHFTTHGFHMNFKGKFWIINKWTSVILPTLSRLQTTPAIPLPWMKENENNQIDHVNKNDSATEKSNILKEDETRKYKSLKLKKAGDLKINPLKN
ncbi:MAG: hypothetical protein LBB45_02670 [Methanobrevibacter sp.]|nr:hypothetical protein [Candidatus Methanovirga basalitermitum]